jgi:O-6-methylguanine DNA methyltransferase
MNSAAISTPDGIFTASFTERGLARLEFPSATPKPASTGQLTAEQRAWLKTTTRAVLAILKGRAPAEYPPLDVSVGTEFQQQVWETLCRIGPGQTLGYGEIADLLGKPRASRAIGQACGANPIPLLIPCHRVRAASGKIGGFSGGLDWKRRLLEREGVTVA